MYYPQYDYEDEDYYYYDEAVSALPGGGCLPVLAIIPPLAVLVLSSLLLWFWFDASMHISGDIPLLSLGSAQTEIAPLFTPEVQYWASDIAAWADKRSLDPNMVATVMQIESCGDPQARSSVGAQGLFQVMPFHFETSENPLNPDTNAKRGLAHLNASLEAHGGDVRLAFAAYNAGINGSKRAEALWPAETIRYTRWAMGIYADAQTGEKHSPTLDEWLARGGASLCAQAAERLGIGE